MKHLSLAVHILTCLGGCCALQAVLAFVAHAPEAGFAWLGLALVIDGIDGPLARRVGVKRHTPHLHGDVLDLVVDFLTYVFAPVVALITSGALAGVPGQLLAGGIIVASLLYFGDDRMKDADNRFVGFPTLWNVVAFYVLALGLGPVATAAVVAVCMVLTFVPLKWLHPVRVVEMRPLTLSVTALWAVACAGIVWSGFPGPVWSRVVLLAVLAYWLGFSVLWAVRERRAG